MSIELVRNIVIIMISIFIMYFFNKVMKHFSDRIIKVK